MRCLVTLLIGVCFLSGEALQAQSYFNPRDRQPDLHLKSVARQWMEFILEGVAVDGRGPTIQARNVFHTTAAMYDTWTAFQEEASPWLLGKTQGEFHCPCEEPYVLPEGMDQDSARDVAISYAAFRVFSSRMNEVSTKMRIVNQMQDQMDSLGLTSWYSETDFSTGNPAALGNYVAQCYLDFGLQDGSGEENQHEIMFYEPVNGPLKPNRPGPQGLNDVNRWQPLSVWEYYQAKGGDPTLRDWNALFVSREDEFVTPEWGKVLPFALPADVKTVYEREGGVYPVYFDPGLPPLFQPEEDEQAAEAYRYGFLTVALWSGHMDPSDGVMIDISPGARRMPENYPATFYDFPNYYDQLEGGVPSSGHRKNPYTGKPYAPNLVPRGDYSRVIAEFWVDGINTASPPGHWFRLLHQVSDHAEFEKRWQGNGPVLSDLDWDIKTYFTLAGAMHDAGIACWGVKGWYDYVRPISAIRWMATQGQSSDPEGPAYSPNGLPLIPGRVELVQEGDPLLGEEGEHLNKVKLYAWRGPDAIGNPLEDAAGVGWILAENWWPYQRFAFTTPPFAGYVSGHSTFSTAAAELLGQMTGDPFFPGGLFEFTARKNEFLEFENGPSQDITLQWATYHDAAHETCLSRIWGGIHPPADDIPGRKIGMQVAKVAFDAAAAHFEGKR